MDERKHLPTAARRQKARQQGRVAHSNDFNAAMVLCAASGLLWYCGPRLFDFLRSVMIVSIDPAEGVSFQPEMALERLQQFLLQGLLCLLPMMCGILVIAVLANWLQIGSLFLPSKFSLDLARANPWAGLQRMLDTENLSRILFGMLKLGLLLAIIGYSCWGSAAEIQSASSLSAMGVAGLVWNTIMRLCGYASAVFLGTGVAEYAIAWWRHEQSLRMTDEEMRQELKDLGGSPQLAMRRQGLRDEIQQTRVNSL